MNLNICYGLFVSSLENLILYNQKQEQVKSSHLYLYSAFKNTNYVIATAQYQNSKTSHKQTSPYVTLLHADVTLHFIDST